jgi:hypothetical protein
MEFYYGHNLSKWVLIHNAGLNAIYETSEADFIYVSRQKGGLIVVDSESSWIC